MKTLSRREYLKDDGITQSFLMCDCHNTKHKAYAKVIQFGIDVFTHKDVRRGFGLNIMELKEALDANALLRLEAHKELDEKTVYGSIAEAKERFLTQAEWMTGRPNLQIIRFDHDYELDALIDITGNRFNVIAMLNF